MHLIIIIVNDIIERNTLFTNSGFVRTRHVELDLASRGKDAELVKLRESAKNKERHLEGTCETLRTQLGEAEVTRRQLEWTITDLNQEKEATVER